MKRVAIVPEPKGLENQMRAQVKALWAVIVVMSAVILAVAALTAVGLVQAQNRGRQITREAVSAGQQNVDARYDDCQSINRLRAGLLAQVKQGHRTLPLLYRLVPSLHTPTVELLEAQTYRRERRELAPLDCRDYALQAVPPARRSEYHAP